MARVPQALCDPGRSRRLSRLAAATLVIIGAAAFAVVTAQSRRQPLDLSVPITFFIADGAGRTGYQAGDRDLAKWALDDWQRASGVPLRLTAAPEAAALIRVYWADPADGQYGEMRPILVGGRRGAAVFIRPATTGLGADVARQATLDPLFRDTVVYLTCVHELGHALGLDHTDDYRDIMYAFGFGGDLVEYFARYRRQLTSRSDIARVSVPSASDLARLREVYPARPR